MNSQPPYDVNAGLPVHLTQGNLLLETLHLFDRPTDALTATIKSITLGTGFGKTFRSHLAAAQQLIQAKAEGRSLVVLYIAPLNSQLTITDEALVWLKHHKIPAVYNRSDNELKKYDNPLGLYQTLTNINATDNNGIVHKLCERAKRYASSTENVDDDSYIDDVGQEQVIERRDLGAAYSVIRNACYRIKKLNERRRYLLPDEQEELDTKFSEANNTLLFMTRKVVQTLLSNNDTTFQSRDDFWQLVDILCPWYQVQQKKLGLISITTSKMLYQQQACKPSSQSGDRLVFTNISLPKLIHEPDNLVGLKNTEYLLMIDEADEAKNFFEQQLSGALIRGTHITQAIGALYREVERFVYRHGQDYLEVMQARKDGYELGSTKLLQDFDQLRERREAIFHTMQAYRKTTGRPLTNQQAVELLHDLQNILYLAVKRQDPGVLALGAAGLFTHGVSGFLNGEKMSGFAVNQYTSRDLLIESLLQDKSAPPMRTSLTGLPLTDWFEVICETLCVVKELNSPNSYAALRRPIRSPDRPDDLHTAPLSSMLRKLSIKATDDIFKQRRIYHPNDHLNIKFAFQSPHVVYALRRAGKGEHNHSIDESTFCPIVPEVTYRLCSAEFFLEQLINPKAYFDFREQTDYPEDTRRHHAFLISATGGFKSNHVGGFVPTYFQYSDYVEFRDMTPDDLALAFSLQIENLNKRNARVFALTKETRYAAPLLKEMQLCQALQGISGLSNPHKLRELQRTLVIWSGMAGYQVTLHDEPDTSQTMAQHLCDEVKCALMIIQTTQHVKKAIAQLVQSNRQVQRKSSVQEHTRQLLYLIKGHNQTKSTLLIFYDKDTDKRLAALRDEEKQELLRQLGLQALSKQLLSVSLLLTKSAKAKILIISAWRSAARGLNFICDDKNQSQLAPSDLDALIIGMPSFYSKVFQQADPDKPSKALEHSITQSHRIYEHAALTSYAPPRLSELSVNAQYHFAGASAFLAKQHAVQQAIDCIQCVGRGERTRPITPVKQFLFINDESLDSYCEAEHLLFNEQTELKGCLSALNTLVMQFAQRRRLARAQLSLDPVADDKAQANALEAYYETKEVMLGDIRRVQNGGMEANSAAQLTTQWSVWHSPQIFLEPDVFQEVLRKEGWPESFVSSLYIPAPQSGRHYVKATQLNDRGFAKLLFDPAEIEHCSKQGQLSFFQPEKTIDSFKVPAAIYMAMEACYPGNLNQALNKEQLLIWRPHLLPEIKGIWGEWVCRAWFKYHFPEWQILDLRQTTPLLELYDDFYETQINQKRLLIAVDAKHWSASTDVHAGNVNPESAHEKNLELQSIADKLGFHDAFSIYFNSQPQVAEHSRASSLDDRGRLITVTGLQRIRDIDIIQPDLDTDHYHSLIDHTLIVNRRAVLLIRQKLTGSVHE